MAFKLTALEQQLLESLLHQVIESALSANDAVDETLLFLKRLTRELKQWRKDQSNERQPTILRAR